MLSHKYLALTDFHVGGRWDKLDRTDDVFRVLDEQVLPIFESGQATHFINLGDTFHTNDPTPRQIARVIAFYQKLDKLGIPSVTLEGNHDHKGRSDKGSALEPLFEVRLQHARFICEARRPLAKPGIPYVFQWPELEVRERAQHFVAIPHMDAAGLAEHLPGILERLNDLESDHPVIGLCHLDLRGAAVGVERLVMRHQPAALPQELIDHPKIGFWLAGHIHKPQELGRVTVVGSLLQNDFGEAADTKHMLLISKDGTSIIPTACPQLRHLDMDFTDAAVRENAEQVYKFLMAADYTHLGVQAGDVVKVTVRISDEDYVGRDFRMIEEQLAGHCRMVYRISPTVIRTREYRMRQLNQQQSDEEIATQYIQARARKDKEELTKMATESIQEVRAK